LFAVKKHVLDQLLITGHRMTDALVLLLEKSSKARRTSIAQDVSFPNLMVSLHIYLCGLLF